ncbi:hypothetical protein BC826DRAFT_973934, partial [Russula brevipes]
MTDQGRLTPPVLRLSPASQYCELAALLDDEPTPRISPPPLPTLPPANMDDIAAIAQHATMVAQAQTQFNRPISEMVATFGCSPPTESPLRHIPPPTYASIVENIHSGDRVQLALVPAPPRIGLPCIPSPTTPEPIP